MTTILIANPAVYWQFLQAVKSKCHDAGSCSMKSCFKDSSRGGHVCKTSLVRQFDLSHVLYIPYGVVRLPNGVPSYPISYRKAVVK